MSDRQGENGDHRAENGRDQTAAYLEHRALQGMKLGQHRAVVFPQLTNIVVDAVEAPVNLFEAPVDTIEPFVDPVAELIKAIVCPALSHCLHTPNLGKDFARV
jgi:hypothetical protein